MGGGEFDGAQHRKLQGDHLETLLCPGSLRNPLDYCLRNVKVRCCGYYPDAARRESESNCDVSGTSYTSHQGGGGKSRDMWVVFSWTRSGQCGREPCWRHFASSQKDELEGWCDPIQGWTMEFPGAERKKEKQPARGKMHYTREENYSLMFPLWSLKNSETHHKKGGQLEPFTQFREHQLKIAIQQEEIHPRWYWCQSSKIFYAAVPSPFPILQPFRRLGILVSWGEQKWEKQKKK